MPKRRNYTREFKEGAIDLLRTSGKPLAEVARELGVSVASLRTSLVSNALNKAMAHRPTGSKAIFHSDRGCQYTSREFRQLVDMYGLRQSMSAKGYCYDNAADESFFASLKRESFPGDCCFPSKAAARRTTFGYLEVFYSRKRRHSHLGNISPEAFLKN